MKYKIGLIVLGIILLACSYLCTYWYEAVYGSDARQFFVWMIGVITAALGFISVTIGVFESEYKIKSTIIDD